MLAYKIHSVASSPSPQPSVPPTTRHRIYRPGWMQCTRRPVPEPWLLQLPSSSSSRPAGRPVSLFTITTQLECIAKPPRTCNPFLITSLSLSIDLTPNPEHSDRPGRPAGRPTNNRQRDDDGWVASAAACMYTHAWLENKRAHLLASHRRRQQVRLTA